MANSIQSDVQLSGVSYEEGPAGLPFVPSTFSTGGVFDAEGDSFLTLSGKQGLSLDLSSIPDRSNYSIVMDIRPTSVGFYNKLISLDGGASDNGLYFFGGKVVFYPVSPTSPLTVTPNEWIRIGLTYDGTDLTIMQGSPSSFQEASSVASVSGLLFPGRSSSCSWMIRPPGAVRTTPSMFHGSLSSTGQSDWTKSDLKQCRSHRCSPSWPPERRCSSDGK